MLETRACWYRPPVRTEKPKLIRLMTEIRVRFAPSPTGELHVGGLRTALFNYLFAKHNGGRFILRIEDTDRSRHVPEAEARIVELLQWAGLDPDEGPHRGGPCAPYRQSERLETYRAAAAELIGKGFAYRCTCSPATLQEMREAQAADGLPIRYDGRCRDLTDQERAEKESGGMPIVVRMKIPERNERIIVQDSVRGEVAFNTEQLDDQVIIKSDGYPTYHLAAVVDDHAMGITHVLRAEEWLSSTPKHLLLYRWLGWQPPQYAHLPLLLNTDRSKMSKRKGDTSVEYYREQGYLPDALVNFIALLGWSPGNDQELISRSELVQKFSVDRVGKTGSVFDRDKLDWMNQQYIKALSVEELFSLVKPFVDASDYATEDQNILRKICAVVQAKLVKLSDFTDHLPLFFRSDDVPIESTALGKIKTVDARKAFVEFRERLHTVDELDAPSFKEIMREVAKSTGVKGKSLWEPMRIALTLETEGPELAAVVEILGKEKARVRIDLALAASG